MKEMTTTPATREVVGVWDPLAWFTGIETDMDRLFSERWPLMRPLQLTSAPPSAVVPRMDVFEQNGSLVIKAELPGVEKEDIAVTVEGGNLVIKGLRKDESEIKEDQYYRMERTAGSYYRRLPLPQGTNPEQLTAEYKDGVLEVMVPKPAATHPAPTKITIR